MHDCPDGNMRDQLPDYVHGALSAAARVRVEAHLETCAECAGEVELIRAAVRAFPDVQIDVAKIVKALPAAPRRASRGMFAGSSWRIAAGLGFVAIGALSVATLGGVFSTKPNSVQAANTPGASSAVGGPDSARSVAVPAPTIASAPLAMRQATGRSISFGGGFSDLTDEQLDTLLGELDALETLPSAEPESHLSTIVPLGEGGHGAG